MGRRTRNDECEALLPAIIDLADVAPDGWHGTARELLADLEARVSPEHRGPAWPCNAFGLGHRLSALAPELAAVGIGLARSSEGHANRRVIHLEPCASAELTEEDDRREARDDMLASLGTWPPHGRGLAGLLAIVAVIVIGVLLAWPLRPPAGVLPAT